MLKGEKVVLRALREADFERWYAAQNDVEQRLLASSHWEPVSLEAARERWLNLLHGSPDLRVEFAIEAEGEYIGTVAIKDISRQSQSGWLGIMIDPAWQGQGYGQDAIRTVACWAFKIHNLRRITLTTWATNARALGAYRAVGFVEEGRMREATWLNGEFVDIVTMGLLRHEWQDAGSR